jgi:hypothetical protein
MSDDEFTAALNALDEARGVIDLMERLEYSLQADKRKSRDSTGGGR